MVAVPPNPQDLPSSPRPVSPMEGAKLAAQKISVHRVNGGNGPPDALKDDSRSPGDKGNPEPTKETVATKLVELKNDPDDDPTKASAEPVNELASGQTPGDDLSDDQSESSLEMEEEKKFELLEVRKRKGHKRSMQTTNYIRLIEDRISILEEELRDLRKLPPPEKSAESKPEGDSGSAGKNAVTRLQSPAPPPVPGESDGPLREVSYHTWENFQGPETATNRVAVVDVLVGDPGLPKKTKGDSPEAIAISAKETIAKASELKISADVSLESKTKLPNRIRVHSSHILRTLKKVSSVDPPHGETVVFLRPFKTLVYCEANIRDEVRTLEAKIGVARKGGSTDGGKKISLQDDAKPKADEQSERPSTISSQNKLETADGSSEDIAPSQEEIKEAEEALAHARILGHFIDRELQCILDLRLRIGNGSVKTISFDNLWLLFNPGDVVYSRAQAFEVLSTSGGQPLDKKKVQQYRQEVKVDDDGHHLYREHETVSPFVVDCYYISFDGRKYGAVQKTFRISTYDGERPIAGLPICPAGFFDDSRREYLYERGKSFLSLTGDGVAFAHRQYDGLVSTSDGEKEEVNSRVIIDFTTAFRMHSKWCPELGLNGPSAVDPREVTGCGGMVFNHEDPLSCFRCYYDWIWEDHRLEQLRASDYMEQVDIKLGRLQHASDLTDDQIILLPDTVYGFVLRNRKWVAFAIDDISDVVPTEENFKDLVIPSRHKRIVEALVKTHSRGPKAAKEHRMEDSRHHADLVRGKGEGIIMLLHGPPGVGKTSTAECVAELCNRPLFQITCGDIGTEPKDVEKNLDDNFRLAHRWGCVLLLDEADVFLTQRGQEDLKRNSLVSVFLRVLEYYPGILFLTTNRVGLFDEAFKSRIHVSLQYPKLDKESSMLVWENNIRRAKRRYDIEEKKVMKFARQTFDALHWNGRQIKNAFQVVIALAEFDALKNPKGTQTAESAEPERVVLRLKWFKKVTDASADFDEYIEMMYGVNEEARALRLKYRYDEFKAGDYGESKRNKPLPKPAPPQRTVPSDDDDDDDSSDESSDSDSDGEPPKPKKKSKDPAKSKKPKQSGSKSKATKKKGKKKTMSDRDESDAEDGSSSGETDAEQEKDEADEEEEEDQQVEEKKPRRKYSRKSKK